MNRNLLRFFLTAAFALAAALSGRAQTGDAAPTVAVSFRGLDIESAPYPASTDFALTLGLLSEGLRAPGVTDQITARLEVGRVYYLDVDFVDLVRAKIQASAPAGYQVTMDGVARERFSYDFSGSFPGYATNSTYIRVQVVPAGGMNAISGLASAPRSGFFQWRMSLGNLSNGSSAGELSLIAPGTLAYWNTAITLANFHYDSSSSEVTVNRSVPGFTGVINSIVTPQVGVELSWDAMTYTATVRVFHREHWGGVGTSPFVEYVFTYTDDPVDTIKIEAKFYKLTDLTDGTPTLEVTKTAKAYRTGFAPNYTWMADGWYTGSSVSRETRSLSSGVESVDVSIPSGATATKWSRTFTTVAGGDEIGSSTLGYSPAPTVTTDYEYYTGDDQSASYGKVLSASTTGGGWEAYEYYDYVSDTDAAGVAGKLKRRHRPYQDELENAPEDPSANELGEITLYEYSADAFGRRTRPAKVETTVGKMVGMSVVSEVVSRSLTSYSSTADVFSHTGLSLVTASRSDSWANGSALTTITKFFAENAGMVTNTDDFFRMQTHSEELPGGMKRSYAYQRGGWGSDFEFSDNHGTDYDEARWSMVSVIMGTSQHEDGDGRTLRETEDNLDGYDIDDLYLVPDQSTMEQTIRDHHGRISQTRTLVWAEKGATDEWELVQSTVYNWEGNFNTKRSHSTGGIEEAEWKGGQLENEIDQAGVKTIYSYDNAGRKSGVLREGSGSIAALTTAYEYNAAHQLKKEEVGSGLTEKLTTIREYDLAGRLSSEAVPGRNAVTIEYNPGARTRKTTFPVSDATRIETFLRDGRLASVTGTAEVAQYYSYDVGTDGVRETIVRAGTDSSTRMQTTYSDWLGRPTQILRPKWGGGNAEENYVYRADSGQLLRLDRTGYLFTQYEYDAFGRISRTGLDYPDLGLQVDELDRITKLEHGFWKDPYGRWWAREATLTYPDGATDEVDDAVLLSESMRRLDGFGGNAYVAESKDTDANGNTTTRLVAVDRGARTGTVTTQRPGYNDTTESLVNGLTTSVTRADGLVYTTAYDALLRPSTVTDPRTGAVTTSYKSGTTLPTQVADTTGTLATTGYDDLGRVILKGDGGGKNTRFAYNARGQLLQQWGSGAYAVEYGYDPTYGDRTALSTFRRATASDASTWPGSGTMNSADTTTFEYDPATALLKKRTDAASRAIDYTYNERGQMLTREWARMLPATSTRVKTTYGYHPATGELVSQTYNDGTPTVEYEYNRLGLLSEVTDASGTRTFAYDAAVPTRLKSETLPGDYGTRVLTPLYETSGDIGRPRGFLLGSTYNSDADLEQTYTLTGGGRLNTVFSQRANDGGTNRTYTYSYLANSALVSGLSDGGYLAVSYGYSSARDLLTSVDTKWNSVSQTRYDYTYNSRLQRETAKQSGDVFLDYGTHTYTRYTYNDRGEVTAALAYLGTDTSATSAPLPGRQLGYNYDSIGNRKSIERASGATEGFYGNATVGNSTTSGGNLLNQTLSRQNLTLPVQGTVDSPTTPVVVEGMGALALRQGQYYAAEKTVANSSGPWIGAIKVHAAKPGNVAKRVEINPAWLAQSLETFTYDLDGNLSSDGFWDYKWDAENRLVSQQTTTAAAAVGVTALLDVPNRLIQYGYDYLGRRYLKRVINASTSAEISNRRYLYHGWNVVAEFTASGDTLDALVRSYTWAPGAASPGALLQIYDSDAPTGPGTTGAKTIIPTYDGNGNVAALLNASGGAIEAAYEYDPFGNLLRAEGLCAKSNPIRFSTKWWDEETCLIYYGYRYYSPGMGRFISRDLIEEAGGLNLYGFCGNDGITGSDVLGMYDPEDLQRFGINPNDSDSSTYSLWGRYFDQASAFNSLIRSMWAENRRVHDNIALNSVDTSFADWIPGNEARESMGRSEGLFRFRKWAQDIGDTSALANADMQIDAHTVQTLAKMGFSDDQLGAYLQSAMIAREFQRAPWYQQIFMYLAASPQVQVWGVTGIARGTLGGSAVGGVNPGKAVASELTQASILRALRANGSAEALATAKLISRGRLNLSIARTDPLGEGAAGRYFFGTRNITIATDKAGSSMSAAGFTAHEARHFLQGITQSTYRRVHEFDAYLWQRAADRSFNLSDPEIWQHIRTHRVYRNVPE